MSRNDGSVRFKVGVALMALYWVCTPAQADSTGLTGHSGKDPGSDCAVCHGNAAGDARIVLDGPTTVTVDANEVYTLILSGPPGAIAGVNVASSAGDLQSVDDNTRVIDAELINRPGLKTDEKGSLRFEFRWDVPTTPGTYSLYAAGIVGNADEKPTADNTLHTRLNVTVEAAHPGTPPIVYIDLPAAALVGEAVFINASRSRDLDGRIVSYEWDFGDGEQTLVNRPIVRHTYVAPGVYTPQLLVTDDDGMTALAAAWIEIRERNLDARGKGPQAVPGGPYLVALGDTVQFDGSQSRAGRKHGRIVSFEWDFGDGFHSSGMAPTHVYAGPGSYLARLTVLDDRGLPGSAIASVRVQDGEWPRLAKFRVPQKVTLKENQSQSYRFPMVADVVGLYQGATRCGIAYLQRNGAPYQNQSVCFAGSEKRRIWFEHVFTVDDAPSVEWSVHLVLDGGEESRFETRVTKVVATSKE
jgi:chitodextrinase